MAPRLDNTGHRGFVLRKLADDRQPRNADGSKALLGVIAVGDLPTKAVIPTSTLERWITDGIASTEGYRVVSRPGGPEGDPWRLDKAHVLPQCDAFTLHLIDGDRRYVVTHQPDKYHDGPAGTDAVGDPTARVDWFYLAELDEQAPSKRKAG